MTGLEKTIPGARIHSGEDKPAAVFAAIHWSRLPNVTDKPNATSRRSCLFTFFETRGSEELPLITTAAR